MSKLRYRNFVDRIDIDEVYAEIGFSPDENDGKGNDVGTCILPHGLHANGDTTGKFAFHRDKRVYNCWVCGGGSLLDLVMTMKNLTDEEATDWLYQFTGNVEDGGEKFLERLNESMKKQGKDHQAPPYYNARVLNKWATKSHPFYNERGISEEVADYFKLGYDPKHRKYAPMKGGVPIDEPFEGPAIILPHFFEGKLMGWQARWLTNDRPSWVPKYVNTTDFPKSYTLWGYDFCSYVPDAPVLVESVPTALMLISMGYTAMATFGASTNEDQIKLLRKFSNGVILAPDKGMGEEKYWELAGRLRRYIPVQWVDPADELAEKDDLGDLYPDLERIHNCVEGASYVTA